MPPMAQSEPSTMVSHRSPSRSRLASRVLAGPDPVNHFHPAHRTDAAGGAFAAGFHGAELHGEPGLLAHVDRVIEHHHPTVADHGTEGGKGLVVDGRVPLARRHVGPQWAAHLHRLQGTTGGGAAAEVLHQLPQGDAKGQLNQTAALDVTRQLEGRVPRDLPMP